MVLAITAVLALSFAWWQIRVSRELAALQAYETYQLECMSHPEFTSGDVNFRKFDPRKLREYESFVLYTLMMDERIFRLFPKDPGWLFSIKDDIRMHKAILSSAHFSEHVEKQGWTFLPLIREIISEK